MIKIKIIKNNKIIKIKIIFKIYKVIINNI